MKTKIFFLVAISLISLLDLWAEHDIDHVYTVVMTGGNGTRLWPLSRRSRPKQCLALPDDTLIEQSIARCELVLDRSHIWISTTQQHEQKMKQLVGHRVGNVVVEPVSRNTGPAILLACMEIYAQDPQAIIIFVPADPFIPKSDWNNFAYSIQCAVEYAKNHDDIVLLGVQPTYPATGYGYIEYDPQAVVDQKPPYRVTKFREKPSQEVAQQYLDDGNKLWNISIFCAQATTFIREFQNEAPRIFSGVHDYMHNRGPYDRIVADSIDYAVIERSAHVSVLPVDFSWCDVGNIEVFLSIKQRYNTLDANFISVGSKNNLVDVPHRLVALVGVDDLCIVEVDDALLITHRKSAEHVRSVVKLLEQGYHRKHL